MQKHTMFTFINLLLILTATTSALIAGLMYAWSCAIIPGLSKLPDSAYIAAVQSFNKAILNPAFFMSFMGTLVLLPLSTVLHFSQPLSLRFWFLLTASLVYIVGVFGITAAGNVPLNSAIESFDLSSATASTMNAVRAKFEVPWNSLHSIRTLASIVVVVLVIMACLSHDNIIK